MINLSCTAGTAAQPPEPCGKALFQRVWCIIRSFRVAPVCERVERDECQDFICLPGYLLAKSGFLPTEMRCRGLAGEPMSWANRATFASWSSGDRSKIGPVMPRSASVALMPT
jgi:hypothetical protein